MADLLLYYRSITFLAFFKPDAAVPIFRAVVAVGPAFLAAAVNPIPVPVTPVSIDTLHAVSTEAALRQHDHALVPCINFFHRQFLPDIRLALFLF